MSLEKRKALSFCIYGMESLGYKVPNEPITHENIELTFLPIETDKDISDYDGVIFLDKTFESINSDGSIKCTNKDEMLKRTKQLFSLFNNGGVICSLIYRIQDKYTLSYAYTGSRTYHSNETSLLKVFLNDIGLADSRIIHDRPLRHFQIMRNEYLDYLRKYGVTETYFNIPYKMDDKIKPIAKLNSRNHAGLIMHNQIFLLPCHAPDKEETSTIKLG